MSCSGNITEQNKTKARHGIWSQRNPYLNLRTATLCVTLDKSMNVSVSQRRRVQMILHRKGFAWCLPHSRCFAFCSFAPNEPRDRPMTRVRLRFFMSSRNYISKIFVQYLLNVNGERLILLINKESIRPTWYCVYNGIFTEPPNYLGLTF